MEVASLLYSPSHPLHVLRVHGVVFGANDQAGNIDLYEIGHTVPGRQFTTTTEFTRPLHWNVNGTVDVFEGALNRVQAMPLREGAGRGRRSDAGVRVPCIVGSRCLQSPRTYGFLPTRSGPCQPLGRFLRTRCTYAGKLAIILAMMRPLRCC